MIKLNWRSHIQEVRRKSLASLASIRRTAYFLNYKAKMLYQSLVLPHLEYCSVVWNNCGVILANQVERVQNYAMRLILCKSPRTSSDYLRQQLGWTTLKKRRQHAMLCQVHRCILIQAPTYLVPKFTTNNTRAYMTTRGATNYT